MDGSTIAVKVRFMGDLRALIQQRDLVVSLPQDSTVGDLLKSLVKRYGEPFSCRVFTGPGTLQHYMLVFVNGQNIKEVGGLEARLGDREVEVEVIMLPMFEGG